MPKEKTAQQFNLAFYDEKEYKAVLNNYKQYITKCKGKPLSMGAWARKVLLKYYKI